jgi:hypothetical protein
VVTATRNIAQSLGLALELAEAALEEAEAEADEA